MDDHDLHAAEAAPAAPASSRENDALQAQSNSLAAERDRLAAALQEATRRAGAAEAELARLRSGAAAASVGGLATLLWALLAQQTNAGVAWLRSKIPADHPGLKWFDWTVETTTQLGCQAIRLSAAFLQWATPRAKALAEKLVNEVQARLAKK